MVAGQGQRRLTVAKRWGAVLAVLVLVLGLAACSQGGDDEREVSYEPAAYGENGRCYYIEDEDEVEALKEEGRCNRSWTPLIMPIFWYSMYAPYYGSLAYRDRYVPSARRAAFASKVGGWERSYANDIRANQARGSWAGSNGTRVSGSAIDYSKATFGSGNARSGGFSSGGRRTCAMGAGDPIVLAAGEELLAARGGGGRGGGGGFGGGGRSGGGSKSGGSKSGSKGGSTSGKSRITNNGPAKIRC
jgi:hypothetical protein